MTAQLIPVLPLLVRGYALLIKAGNMVGLFLLLFFRINWGWQFFISGKGKLLDHQSVADFFTTLHLPFAGATAWFVGGVECIGGILLLAGLAARPLGLILSINMAVAYVSVESDRQTVFNFFKDQDSFLHADPFFFLLTALLAFSFGAGPFSLDWLIAKWLRQKGLVTGAVAPPGETGIVKR